MDRKIVKPAQEGGKIWNPDHNSFLPPAGAEVLMTPYWLSLVQRKDVMAGDVPTAAEAEASTTADVASPDGQAAIVPEQGAAPAA